MALKCYPLGWPVYTRATVSGPVLADTTPPSSNTTSGALPKACRKAFGKPPLLVFELGGVVSANTGPDTVALVYTGHPRG